MKESNEELELPLKEIKIGRETYKIYPGDYIMDNGACLQFCTNGRVLKYKDWTKHTSLVIPKTTFSKVVKPILHLLEEKKGGKTIIRYYFRKIKLENGKD